MSQIAETLEQMTKQMDHLRNAWGFQRMAAAKWAPTDLPTYFIPNRNAAPVVAPKKPVDDELNLLED